VDLAKSRRKELVSIRLSQDALSHYRAKGEGGQTKIDETSEKSRKRNLPVNWSDLHWAGQPTRTQLLTIAS
jgi:hypothetical protein